MLRGEIKDVRSAIAAILVLGAIGAIVLPVFGVGESRLPPDAPAAVEASRPGDDAAARVLAASPGGYRILRASWQDDSSEETDAEGSKRMPPPAEDVPEEVQRMREEARKRWRNLDIAVSPR